MKSKKKILEAEGLKMGLYSKDTLPKEYTSRQMIKGSVFDYSYKVVEIGIINEVLREFEPVTMFSAYEQKNNFSNEVELFVVEHSYLCFLTPKGRIAKLGMYDGKHHFFPAYWYYGLMRNVDTYKRREYAQEVKGPNKIGVFTRKKVHDWLEYCDKEVDRIEKVCEAAEAKNAEIRQRIAQIIHNAGKDARVTKGDNWLRIDLGKFRIMLTHNISAQHLSIETEFLGNHNDAFELSKPRA